MPTFTSSEDEAENQQPSSLDTMLVPVERSLESTPVKSGEEADGIETSGETSPGFRNSTKIA